MRWYEEKERRMLWKNSALYIYVYVFLERVVENELDNKKESTKHYIPKNLQTSPNLFKNKPGRFQLSVRRAYGSRWVGLNPPSLSAAQPGSSHHPPRRNFKTFSFVVHPVKVVVGSILRYSLLAPCRGVGGLSGHLAPHLLTSSKG